MTLLSDQEVKSIQHVMSIFESYSSPTEEHQQLIERAEREGLVQIRAKYLISWTSEGVKRFRNASNFK